MEPATARKGKNRANQGAAVGHHPGLHLFQIGGINNYQRFGRTMARIGIQTETKAAVRCVGVIIPPVLENPAKDTGKKVLGPGKING